MVNYKFEPMSAEIKEAVGNNSLWNYVDSLSQIPRVSGNEKVVIDYIMSLARLHGHSAIPDDAGNLLVRVNGEGDNYVGLQAHVDIVGEKIADSTHDFARDSIELITDGTYLSAKGTTAGFDNGVGVAYMLKLMSDPEKIPNLELLFTVEEEIGLIGASNLGHKLRSKYLINLDSEEEGTVTIGCAGGNRFESDHEFEREGCEDDKIAYSLEITGLPGGHSGIDINNPKIGHPVSIGSILLHNLMSDAGINLVSLYSGNSDNAIPREFRATFVSSKKVVYGAKDFEVFYNLMSNFRDEYGGNFSFKEISGKEINSYVSTVDSENILRVFTNLRSGVYASEEELNIPRTSNSIGSVKLDKDGSKLSIIGLTRSSDNKELSDVLENFEKVCNSNGFSFNVGSFYPGWKPDLNSELLKIVKGAYHDLTSEELEVVAIHAGLECGAIVGKFPRMQAISIGPNITGVHTPSERVEIASVERIWSLLKATLERLI